MAPAEVEKILKEAFPDRWRAFGEALGARRKADRDLVKGNLREWLARPW